MISQWKILLTVFPVTNEERGCFLAGLAKSPALYRIQLFEILMLKGKGNPRFDAIDTFWGYGVRSRISKILGT